MRNGSLPEVVPEHKYLESKLSAKLCSNGTQSDLVGRGKSALLLLIKSFRKILQVTSDAFFKLLEAQIQCMLLDGAYS